MYVLRQLSLWGREPISGCICTVIIAAYGWSVMDSVQEELERVLEALRQAIDRIDQRIDSCDSIEEELRFLEISRLLKNILSLLPQGEG
jgi:hypothetical protein